MITMKKRPTYEVVIVVAVVVLSILLGGGLFSGRAKLGKMRLLIQELSMLRSGITHFMMIKRHVPSSLEALVKETYKAGELDAPFIDRVPRSDKGETVDPFGNPYRYDTGSGWVASTTRGFEKW